MVSNQMLLASYGVPKLLAFSANGTVLQKIVFPTSVVFADSYLNDVRFDLRPNVTSGGKGVAYLTDSSLEGRNGIVVVDSGTGQSWRHLNGVEQVRPDTGFKSSYNGQPFLPLYPDQIGLGQGQYGQLRFGADGIAISQGESRTWHMELMSGRPESILHSFGFSPPIQRSYRQSLTTTCRFPSQSRSTGYREHQTYR